MPTPDLPPRRKDSTPPASSAAPVDAIVLDEQPADTSLGSPPRDYTLLAALSWVLAAVAGLVGLMLACLRHEAPPGPSSAAFN